jgi:hypothetical protein
VGRERHNWRHHSSQRQPEEDLRNYFGTWMHLLRPGQVRPRSPLLTTSHSSIRIPHYLPIMVAVQEGVTSVLADEDEELGAVSIIGAYKKHHQTKQEAVVSDLREKEVTLLHIELAPLLLILCPSGDVDEEEAEGEQSRPRRGHSTEPQSGPERVRQGSHVHWPTRGGRRR